VTCIDVMSTNFSGGNKDKTLFDITFVGRRFESATSREKKNV